MIEYLQADLSGSVFMSVFDFDIVSISIMLTGVTIGLVLLVNVLYTSHEAQVKCDNI